MEWYSTFMFVRQRHRPRGEENTRLDVLGPGRAREDALAEIKGCNHLVSLRPTLCLCARPRSVARAAKVLDQHPISAVSETCRVRLSLSDSRVRPVSLDSDQLKILS